jgi:hypothetical protein
VERFRSQFGSEIVPLSEPVYMLMLSGELRNENSQIHTRNGASLALTNALSARVR